MFDLLLYSVSIFSNSCTSRLIATQEYGNEICLTLKI